MSNEKTLLIRNLFEDTICEVVVENDKVISQMNNKLEIEKVNGEWIAISKLRKAYLKQLIREEINEFWSNTSQKFKKSSWK